MSGRIGAGAEGQTLRLDVAGVKRAFRASVVVKEEEVIFVVVLAWKERVMVSS